MYSLFQTKLIRRAPHSPPRQFEERTSSSPPPRDLLSSLLSKSGSNRKANEFLLDLDVDLLDAQHHDFSAVYVQSSVKTMLLEPNKIANNTTADLPSY